MAILLNLVKHFDPHQTLYCTARGARLRNYGDRAFCVATPKLWNSLPLNMRECGSVKLHSFKRLLKTHLIKRAINI